MPLVIYKCENGHKTAVERDEIDSPTIACSTCKATIDRFNSKNIVEGIDILTGEILVGKRPTKVAQLCTSHWKSIAGLSVGLLAALIFFYGDKAPSINTAPVAPQNQIEDIAYTQTMTAGKEDGVYNIHLAMRNTGPKDQNHPPAILIEFLKQQGTGGSPATWTRTIPTAIYPPSFYAPTIAESTGFTKINADLEIQLPPGTQAVVTCLTYQGVADMLSARCQQKVTEALSTAQTQGESK